jgi:flagellar hook assembly protein FlgD
VTRSGLGLARPQPNPFTRGTLLRFDLAQAGRATLDVVDVAGQHVVTLWSGETAPGPHSVRWDGRDARGAARPVGVYFVRLEVEDRVLVQKLVRVR